MEEKKTMKLWQKGYTLNSRIEAFTVGEDYLIDQKLVDYDCLASKAHAAMLCKIGILTDDELEKILNELDRIIELNHNGRFPVTLKDEDCHTAIENRLTESLGETGKKIHTGRSRNDQVLAALRLYYKDRLMHLKDELKSLKKAVDKLIESSGSIPIPGYTHTRKAMPSSVGLWAGALSEALEDDLLQLESVYALVDQSPLGSGAGYGVPLNLDREMVAEELGFSKIQKNPVYVQSSRGKFEAALLHLAGFILFDANKTATDLILFTLPDFGFFELPETFLTGSSIMPQKKNPDVLELIRANYHVVLGYEMQVKSLIGNLISGYHRDFQLLKEPVMKSLEILLETVSILTLVFENLTVNEKQCKKAMTDELFTTEKVYDLVKKGMSFREAYRRVIMNDEG
ncbi:TPA: argininosuccinate lyase [Candidatus Marinimicrobia bacterium]|nr:MAG: Argininosuccinate lyase [Marinimicrobia bacterium 46_43]HAE87695.1 argininosuccinate lyase [Candidatus Neomarinimicrobiota bacterium]HBY19294.1 argininosuccinate lyase [Candidatus Neomarinimicrobiota bacterium]